MEGPTPFLTDFLKHLQYELDDELQEARSNKQERKQLEALQVTWELLMQAVVHATVYEVREGAHMTIVEQIENMYATLEKQGTIFPEPYCSWMEPLCSPVPIILELVEELSFPTIPLKVKAFYFHQFNNALLAQQIRYPLPSWINESFADPKYPENKIWLLEAITKDRVPPLNQYTGFVVRYDGTTWSNDPKRHLCPLEKCKIGHPLCPSCQKLLQTLSVYFCMGLQAAAGTFQQIVAVEHPSERRTSLPSSSPAYSRPRIRYLDVEERKVYHDPDPEKEENEHNRERHPFWTSHYNPEEIDLNEHPARAHPRTYRNGNTVMVRKSKDRRYPKLRDGVTVLDKRKKKQQDSD